MDAEKMTATFQMIKYLPYIVTVVCSLISGWISYSISRRQTKADIKKLEKQYELDIEKEREKFSMEKEKMELEHKHQLELKEKDLENSLGTSLANTLIGEALKMPEVRQQIAGGTKPSKKNRR